MTRQLKLNLFVYPGGHHEAAWRYRGSEPDRVLDLGYYIDLARRAEDATFDAIFLADGPALADNVRYASRFRIEPAGARGHWVVAGTPEQVADRIEEWFTRGAADGFNVMPPWLTGGFDLFAEHVVPVLRARGLFRTAYTGSTLREHYGLSRPASQYAVQAVPT